MPALDRILEAAAEARSSHYPQPVSRPSQRRHAEEAGSRPAGIVRAQITLTERAAGDSADLHFSGFASVYDRGYEMWDMFGPYTEQVTSGAGERSLAQPNLDVPLVLSHDSMRRIARTTNGTLSLSETEIDGVSGLLADAPALDPADADVAYIAPKLRAGLIDEMSFRFRIEAGEWSPDWSEYHIQQYDINRGDVAIVGYGANPHTQGAGLRAGERLPELRDLSDAALRRLENALHAERKARGNVSSMSLAELDDILRRSVFLP